MINTNFGKYFIAIDVPCELKDEISFKTKNYFNSKDLVVNNKSKYHITLFYLGQTSIDVAKNLFFKVPDFKPFQLTLSNIGYFNTRVIWLGVIDPDGNLNKIHQIYLNENLKPHITLARNKIMKRNKFQELIQSLQQLNLRYDFIVKEIGLYESYNLNGENQYRVIATKKLN